MNRIALAALSAFAAVAALALAGCSGDIVAPPGANNDVSAPATEGGPEHEAITATACEAKMTTEGAQVNCCPRPNEFGIGPPVAGNRAERTDTGIRFPEEPKDRYNRLIVVDGAGGFIDYILPDRHYNWRKGVEFYIWNHWGEDRYFLPACSGWGIADITFADINQLEGPGITIVVLDDGLLAISLFHP